VFVEIGIESFPPVGQRRRVGCHTPPFGRSYLKPE